MARVEPPDNQTAIDGVEQILCPICHRPNIARARFCQHCGRDVVLNNDGPQYRITRIIKQGGQGAVYEVVGQDGKPYAVKEMLERALDPKDLSEALARFDQEANLLQSLSHPHIPRVYDHFKDEGRSYLAMDFVRGEDMEELLRRGPLPEARALEIADQICDVLAYLHGKGLIYRDMKPSNVMVEPQGNIKLVDFGIAKAFQRDDYAAQIGTPGYAPPEQYQGVATAESDIYALGATLHHMLTGRDPRDEAPFSFPSITSLAPKVSARTVAAIERALQMKPEDRFRTAQEFRAALRPLAAPSVPTTRQVRRQPAPQVAAPARTQTPPATTTQPAPAVPAAPQPQPIQPNQSPTRRSGGFFAAVGRFIRNLLTVTVLLVVLAAAGVMASWYFIPDIAQPILRPYLPEIVVENLPTRQQPSTPLTSAALDLSVEATVPATASDQEIQQALVESYKQAVATQYGTSATINTNIPIAPKGGWELLSEANGYKTYRATMSGWVQTGR